MKIIPKVVVFGAGSIGRRHIENLLTLNCEVAVWRQRVELGKELQDLYDVTVFEDALKAIETADAVVVATATDQHMDVAIAGAKAGKALYIEKPLSSSSQQVRELVNKIEEHRLVVEMGCQYRSHPSLQYIRKQAEKFIDGPILSMRAAVGQRLDQWRPGTDPLLSYSADSGRGGGALFDLIHEIDLALWIAGPISDVFADLRTVGDLKMRAEDMASLTLSAQNNAVIQLQMDMVSPTYRRNLELVCRDAIYRWDDTSGIVVRSDIAGTNVVHQTPHDFERNTLFLNHMDHFLSRLDDPTVAARCPVGDGVTALNIALAARNSAKQGSIMPVQPAR